MYRNGRFIDMGWGEMAKIHEQRFKAIQDTLGRFCDSTKIKQNNSDTCPTLGEIAEFCIDQCRERLFCKNREGTTNFVKYKKTPLAPETVEIEKALCKHLIVTFTYQTLCDNLEPYSVGRYCDILYDCYGSFENIDNDYRRANKKELAHKVRRKLDSLQEYIGLHETDPENGWIPTLKKAGFSFKKNQSIESCWEKMFLKQDLSQRKIPPPAAWFLLAFAKDQVNLLKLYEKENKQTFTDVAEALRKATYMGALLQHEIYQYRSLREQLSSCDLPMNFPLMRFYESQYSRIIYAGVPVSEDFSKQYKQIPEESYKLRQDKVGIKGEVKISAGLQRIFNNYLVERNFHVRTMTLAMNTILIEGKVKFDIQEKFPLELLRLHAPLVQGALLSTQDKMDWGWVVERWNHEALPVLEEMFIVNVRRNYSSILDFMDAVYKWCEENNVEDSMSIIRFISFRGEKKVGAHVPNGVQHELEKLQGEIMRSAMSLYLIDPYCL